ncbi:MAG: alpha/beta hydrolase domain-containing protein [Vicinamibacterales bacterium]
MRQWGARHGLIPALVVLLLAAAPAARADVTRVEVKTRAPIGASGYEKISGLVYFAVNPRTAANSVIADLEKAAPNHDGKVEFSADFYILRPLDASKSNHVALVDVLNRGRKMVLGGFNRGGTTDPATDADLGDGFLMQRGFTVAWVGWEFDVRRSSDADRGAGMGISVPTARGVSDVVHASFTPNDEGPQTVGDLAGYRPLDANARDTALSVRDGEFGVRQPIARDRYTVKGNVVTLSGGFEKGRTYELSYRPAEWAVAGLGLAAYRDFTSWLKHSPDSLAPVEHAIGFGSSQSGRFLRTFLYYGFNADEQGRRVLEGAMVHIAGAARLSLNDRGAQPTSLTMYAATQFPFATTADRDPITRRTDGLLENGRALKSQPKIMFTNTAVEYWGGGRAAALIHTTPDGKRDLTLPANVRAYFLTGAQHGPAPFPTPPEKAGQQPANPLEYWWTMRALLVAMTDWVTKGTEPPASQVPRLADGTLVTVAKLKFPALNGVANPRLVQGPRVEGHDLPFLVPQVDADGNELAGIRTPEHRAAMATFTGWNFRSAAIGGTSQLVNLLGAALPFATTKAAREAAGDPRRSIEERYPAKAAYTAVANEAAEALVKGGYLLRDDVAAVMTRVDAWWASTHPATSR